MQAHVDAVRTAGGLSTHQEALARLALTLAGQLDVCAVDAPASVAGWAKELRATLAELQPQAQVPRDGRDFMAELVDLSPSVRNTARRQA